MEKLLREIAEKYELEGILKRLNELNEKLNLQIAFLGEFSSGKSTLINAIIGKKILPAMEQPTTKSIIEIFAHKNVKDIEFYEKTEEGDYTPIEPVVFQEIALGKAEGTCLIKIPPSNILKEGYFFIDTPGVSSIDETDTDITYGYLPFIDGAVICQDINFGTLTNSILKFLEQPAIKPIINNFIFVLTKADTKDSKAIQEVKENVINLLKEKNKEWDLKLDNIESKVLAISAKEILENNKTEDLAKIEEAFNKVFFERKRILEKERKNKELKNIAEDIIAILKDKLENLDLNDEELKEKEKEIKETIEGLEKKKAKEENKLVKLEAELLNDLNELAENSAASLANINDMTSQEEIKSVTNEITNELYSLIESKINIYLTNFPIPKSKFITQKTEREIKQILKVTELGKLITTAAIFAGVGGRTGLEGNAIEAASGGMTQELKQLSKTGKALKTTGKEIAVKEVSTGRKFLQAIGDIMKNINPIEHIGDLVASKWIYTKSKNNLKREFNKIASKVIENLEEFLGNQVFEPMTEELKQLEKNLQQVKKEKQQKLEEVNNIKTELKDYITKLKLNLK